MAFSSLYLLAHVKTFTVQWPPFSVVLTLWLSILTALGSGFLSMLSRYSTRKMSLIRSNTPASRHLMKYQYTLLHGGKSEGIILQEMPPLSTYSIPFTISRREYLGGLPLRVGERWGSSLSSFSHWVSVRSVGYLLFVDCIDCIPYYTHYSLFRHPLRLIVVTPFPELRDIYVYWNTVSTTLYRPGGAKYLEATD